MEEIVKLVNDRLLAHLGQVARVEESIAQCRVDIADRTERRDHTVAEAIEFIAFLDLNDKEWRNRLADDQKATLLRVENLKLVTPEATEPIGPGPATTGRRGEAIEHVGYVRVDRLTRNTTGTRVRVIRLAGAVHESDLDEDYEYHRVYVGKDTL